MTELRAQLVVTADAREVVGAGRQGEAALQGLTNKTTELARETKSAAGASELLQQEMLDSRAAVDALRAAHDPLFAATRRLEAGEETLARAFQIGSIRAREHDQILGLLRAEYQKTAAAQAQLGRGAIGASAGMRNLGLQFGQVAQQGAVTGNYLQALAIQLPDLALGFGTIGIAAGVAAGALLPFIGSVLDAGDGAEATEDKISALASAVSAYKDAIEAARAPTEELIAQHGRLAEAASRSREVMADVAGDAAVRELEALRTDLVAQFGVFDEAITSVEQFEQALADLAAENANFGRLFGGFDQELVVNLEAQLGQITRLQDEFALTREEAIGLSAAVDAFGRAEGVEAIRETAAVLRDRILEATGGIENMNDSLLTSFVSIAGATDQAIALAAAIDDAADGAARINEALFRDAALEYGRIQNTFGSGPDAARAAILAERPVIHVGDASAARARRPDRRAGRATDREHEQAVRAIRRELDLLADSYAEDAAVAQRWRDETLAALDPARAGYQEFAEDVEHIFQERLAEAYLDDLERRTDWQAGMERALNEIQDGLLTWADVTEGMVTSWSSGIEDAFVDLALTGKASVGDLVDYTLDQLARLAFQSAVQPGLEGLVQGAGGFIGDALGSLFTSHTGSEIGRSSLRQSHSTLRSDERLTVTRLGQRVFTPQQAENGAMVVEALALAAQRPAVAQPAAVSVTVNNRSEARVEVSEEPGGGVKIDILGQIERDMAGRVATGRGPLAQAMATTFSLRRNFGSGQR